MNEFQKQRESFFKNIKKAKQSKEIISNKLIPKRYRLIKTFEGRRKIVAFGLTEKDAKMLIRHIHRQLIPNAQPNERGVPYFTYEEVISEKETV